LCFVLFVLAVARYPHLVDVAAPVIPWVHSEPIDIYESTALSGGNIVAGTGSNYPKDAQVQVFDIKTKAFQNAILLPEPYTAASAKLFAYLSQSQTGVATVSAHLYGTNATLWTFPLQGENYIPEKGGIRFSGDGSRLFVSVNHRACNCAKVFWFDGTSSGNGVPLGTYTGPNNLFIRDMVVSNNGTICAMDLSGTITVLNTKAASPFSYKFPASDDILCMDADANYIGYGFTTTWVLAHSGAGSYKLVLSYTVPNTVAFSCAIGGSAGRYNFAVGYSDFTYTQNTVAKWSLNSSTTPNLPDWTWTGPKSAGGFQDGLFNAATTPTGNYLAFSGWGNSQATSPQVVVFSATKPTPIYTFVTPGSMFDIDVFQPNPTSLYVSAAGKHVHANQFGDGGDLYFFNIHLK